MSGSRLEEATILLAQTKSSLLEHLRCLLGGASLSAVLCESARAISGETEQADIAEEPHSPCHLSHLQDEP